MPAPPTSAQQAAARQAATDAANRQAAANARAAASGLQSTKSDSGGTGGGVQKSSGPATGPAGPTTSTGGVKSTASPAGPQKTSAAPNAAAAAAARNAQASRDAAARNAAVAAANQATRASDQRSLGKVGAPDTLGRVGADPAQTAMGFQGLGSAFGGKQPTAAQRSRSPGPADAGKAVALGGGLRTTLAPSGPNPVMGGVHISPAVDRSPAMDAHGFPTPAAKRDAQYGTGTELGVYAGGAIIGRDKKGHITGTLGARDPTAPDYNKALDVTLGKVKDWTAPGAYGLEDKIAKDMGLTQMAIDQALAEKSVRLAPSTPAEIRAFREGMARRNRGRAFGPIARGDRFNPADANVVTHWSAGQGPEVAAHVEVEPSGNIRFNQGFSPNMGLQPVTSVRAGRRNPTGNAGLISIASQGLEPNREQLAATENLGSFLKGSVLSPNARISAHPELQAKNVREGIAVRDALRAAAPTDIAAAAARAAKTTKQLSGIQAPRSQPVAPVAPAAPAPPVPGPAAPLGRAEKIARALGGPAPTAGVPMGRTAAIAASKARAAKPGAKEANKPPTQSAQQMLARQQQLARPEPVTVGPRPADLAEQLAMRQAPVAPAPDIPGEFNRPPVRSAAEREALQRQARANRNPTPAELAAQLSQRQAPVALGPPVTGFEPGIQRDPYGPVTVPAPPAPGPSIADLTAQLAMRQAPKAPYAGRGRVTPGAPPGPTPSELAAQLGMRQAPQPVGPPVTGFEPDTQRDPYGPPVAGIQPDPYAGLPTPRPDPYAGLPTPQPDPYAGLPVSARPRAFPSTTPNRTRSPGPVVAPAQPSAPPAEVQPPAEVPTVQTEQPPPEAVPPKKQTLPEKLADIIAPPAKKPAPGARRAFTTGKMPGQKKGDLYSVAVPWVAKAASLIAGQMIPGFGFATGLGGALIGALKANAARQYGYTGTPSLQGMDHPEAYEGGFQGGGGALAAQQVTPMQQREAERRAKMAAKLDKNETPIGDDFDIVFGPDGFPVFVPKNRAIPLTA